MKAWQERFKRKVNKLGTCALLTWYMDQLSPDEHSSGSMDALWRAAYVEMILQKRIGKLVLEHGDVR